MTKTYWTCRSDMLHYVASTDYNGETVRSANCMVYDDELYSYFTVVAKLNRKNRTAIYTGKYYSQTTSTTISEFRRAFDHYKLMKVYDFDLNRAFDRIKTIVEMHTERPSKRREERVLFCEQVDSLSNLVTFYGKGKRYLNTKVYKTAVAMANNYVKLISEKDKRTNERLIKREEEYKRRQREMLDRTIAICNEFNPNLMELKTFKGVLDNNIICLDNDWLKEHHPDVLEDIGRPFNEEKYLFFYRTLDNGEVSVEYHRYQEYPSFVRKINRYAWTTDYAYYPDILAYNKKNKMLYTNQHCKVSNGDGSMFKLLGLILKAIEQKKDLSVFNGRHCGPYTIEGYNANENFLRVGCHCFLLENLKEVYEDMKS